MKSIKILYAKPGSPFKSFRKVTDYLYELRYDMLDYASAYEYFKKDSDTSTLGGCSCARSGAFFGRNLDWTYDEQAEFIIHSTSKPGRHASVGVAGGFSQLTDSFTSSKILNDLYIVLPFRMRDGINDCGVFACMNVVPLDKGINVSVPKLVKKNEVCGSMLIRFVLDKFSNATDAVNYIRDYVSVYFLKSLHDNHYELHYMIGDSSNTYSLEFVNNEAVVNEISNRAAMTNFYLDGVSFNSDGSVYTPETQDSVHNAVDTNKITENGAGLERYNSIVSTLSSVSSKKDMQDLMHSLIYSRAYSTYTDPSYPFWYSEYAGILERTCKSSVQDFIPIVENAGEQYLKRSRKDGLLWHTTHTSVYDIHDCTLHLTCQEALSREFKFTI